MPSTALHIKIISLVNGMNKVIQEPDEDTSEVQVNIMEDNEDLNMTRSSRVNCMKSRPTLHN